MSDFFSSTLPSSVGVAGEAEGEEIPTEEKFHTIKDGKGVACTIPLTSVIGTLIYGFFRKYDHLHIYFKGLYKVGIIFGFFPSDYCHEKFEPIALDRIRRSN